LIAAFANFPGGFGQPWQVVTLTPIDDFVGDVEGDQSIDDGDHHWSHDVELFFIYFAAAGYHGRSKTCSRQLQAIESLNFDTPARPPSNIQEIAKLESAASLLRTSLKSFSSFVPLDVVRQLIKSGIPLTLASSRDSSPCSFPIWRIFPVTPKRWRLTTFWSRSRPIWRRSRLANLGGRRHRRQVHRRWRHGVLECPRLNALTTSFAPALLHCGRRAAWNASTMSGSGRTTTNPPEDRTQLRQGPCRQCRFFEPAELHRTGRRCETLPPASKASTSCLAPRSASATAFTTMRRPIYSRGRSSGFR